MAEAERRSPGHAYTPPQAGTPVSVPSALRDHLIDSLLHPDLKQADQLLGDMLAFYSPEELTLQVIGPALNEIGEAWEQAPEAGPKAEAGDAVTLTLADEVDVARGDVLAIAPSRAVGRSGRSAQR